MSVSSERAEPAPRAILLTAVSCALVAALLYAPARQGRFVWDDRVLIVENDAALDEWGDAFRAFAHPAIDRSTVSYYRPILMASYVFDRQFWGATPRGFHVTNVTLHAFDAALVAILLCVLTGSVAAAAIGALFFAVHPVQAQAVSLILGRNDLLLVPPVVAMLLADERWRRSGRPLWAVAAVAAYAATVWTKETGLLVAALIPAASLPERPTKKGTFLFSSWVRRKEECPLFFALLGVAVCYFLVRAAIFGRLVGDEAYGAATLSERVLDSVAILAYYVEHVALPWGFSPTPWHPGLADPASGAFWRALLVDAAFAGALVWSLFRRPRLGFALLFFLVTLLPVLGLVRMKLLILEHRLYLPMVGAALAVATASAPLVSGPRRSAVLTTACILLVFLALATAQRIPVFQDALSLWQTAAEATPLSSYAREEYGTALQQAGRHAEAVAELEAALGLDPRDTTARYSLAFSLEALGERPRAVTEVTAVLAESPRYVQAWNLLGVLRKRDGDLEAAEAALRRGLAVRPHDTSLLSNLRNVLRLTGRDAEAQAIEDEVSARAARRKGLATSPPAQ